MVAARLLLLAGLGLPAAAHVFQITGITIRTSPQGTSVAVTVHLPMAGGGNPAAEIPRRLHLRLDDAIFRATAVNLVPDPSGDTLTWEATTPQTAGSFRLESPIFPEVAGETTIVALYRSGRLVDRAALTAQHPSAILGENTTAVVRRFIEMGIAHILSGPDHILFVIGLILAGGGVRRLLTIVSAFTLAHSITLSATALGVASLSPSIVEPVIAFSILVVGTENLLSAKPKFTHRALMAFGFGFFHGFGFAGALTESGLPSNAIAASLAAFNFGVELGQALVVALCVPLLVYLDRRSPEVHTRIVRAIALAIAAAGAIWFVQRTFLH